MSPAFTVDKAILVKVMAWCRQAEAINWAKYLCRHMASLSRNEWTHKIGNTSQELCTGFAMWWKRIMNNFADIIQGYIICYWVYSFVCHSANEAFANQLHASLGTENLRKNTPKAWPHCASYCISVLQNTTFLATLVSEFMWFMK